MKRIISNVKVEIPDGEYTALWSSYNLDILFPFSTDVYVSIESIDGVRGMNCPIKVEVKDGIVSEIYITS